MATMRINSYTENNAGSVRYRTQDDQVPGISCTAHAALLAKQKLPGSGVKLRGACTALWSNWPGCG